MDVAQDWVREPFDTSGWNPRVAALYAHWRKLPRAAGPLPPRASFDPFDIPQVLGSVWLLDVHRDPFRLRYRLVGTHVANALGVDPTGSWIEDLLDDAPRARRAMPRFAASALDGAPTWARMRPILSHAETWREVENLFLPFAADGATPDILMCMTVFYASDGREY